MENSTLYLFLGWDTEYDELAIKEISSTSEIKHIKFGLVTKILSWIPIWGKVYLDKKINSINVNNKKLILIVNDSRTYIRLIGKINCKKILVLRNTLSEKFKDKLKIFDKIYSFDPLDCKKNNFIFLQQFIPYKFILHEKNNFNEYIKYDIYFIGINKGRKRIVDSYIEFSNKNNLNNKILLFKDYKILRSIFGFLIRVPFTYKENIRMVIESNVLLDINKKNQQGITLRVLEALILDKKIITNNKNIINYGFNNKNIFITDDDFLKIPNKDFFIDRNVYVNDKSGIENYSLNKLIENLEHYES